MSVAPVGGAAATSALQAPTKATGEAAEAQEGFERMLVSQLTKQLVDSAMPEDGESTAATGAYKQMLPDALTEALMSGGGIGLAKQLAEASRAATA